MRFSRSSAVALAAALPPAAAQTFTDCDPTKKSCPANTGLNAASFSSDFTKGSGSNASWSAAAYTTINYGDQGAEFTIANANQAPTIQTDFYVFFGRVEVKMKSAPGTGIVSSIVLESDDLDEIDWEFVSATQVETNFFGKGNTTDYTRATYYDVATPQDTFHTYTVDWTAERLEFIIDGTTVRTLQYNDPKTNGGQNYPQTPMRVKLGNWGVSNAAEGTVEWAGGKPDFNKGPFTMTVQSVSITNYNPGASYEWSEQTGSYQSIKVVKDGGSSGSTIGTSSASSNATATSTAAPTSSVAVHPVVNSNVAVPTTLTGSAYSTNTASVSAQNANSTGKMSSTTGVMTQPTASGPTSASRTASGTTSPSSSVSGQTGTSGATLNPVMTVGSLISIVLAFWMM